MNEHVLVLFSLYFAQGVPYGIQARLLPILLRTRDFSLSKVGLSRLLSFPWLLKVLIAPLVDELASLWLWLSLSLLGMAVLFGAPALLGTEYTAVILMAVFGLNVMAAVQDVAVDSLAIRILKHGELGLGNIAQVVGYKVGALVGGGMLLWISTYITWETLFSAMACLYAVGALCAFIVDRNSKNHQQHNHMDITIHKGMMHEESIDTQLANDSSSFCAYDRGILVTDKNQAINAKYSGTDSMVRYGCRWDRIDKKLTTIPTGSKLVLMQKDDNFSGQIRLSRSNYIVTESVKCAEHSMRSSDSCDQVLKQQQHQSISTLKGLLYTVYNSKGFKWLLLYVAVYKLGEQGMASMVPLFLLDKGMTAGQVGLITGVWAQFFSISGSTLGGCLAGYWNTNSNGLIKLLVWISAVRLLPMVLYCLTVFYGQSTAALVTAECTLQFVGGCVTTVTFTLMMQHSKNAPIRTQATHFSTLATVEVLGKLTMISLSGVIVEMIGYEMFFVLCVLFAFGVIPVLNCQVNKTEKCK